MDSFYKAMLLMEGGQLPVSIMGIEQELQSLQSLEEKLNRLADFDTQILDRRYSEVGLPNNECFRTIFSFYRSRRELPPPPDKIRAMLQSFESEILYGVVDGLRRINMGEEAEIYLHFGQWAIGEVANDLSRIYSTQQGAMNGRRAV